MTQSSLRAGFAALPRVVQGIILSLVRAGNAKIPWMEEGVCEVSGVCRFFEARAFLDARRATQLPDGGLRSLAALPYCPALQSVSYYDDCSARSVCAMLSSHSRLTPHLTELHIESESESGAPGAVAALASNTQLGELILALGGGNNDRYMLDSVAPPQPVPQLPQLPALHDLFLYLTVTGDDAASGIALGLTSLSGMTQLTSLSLNMHDRRGVQDSFGEAYIQAAMQPVAHALRAPTGLRTLGLGGWSCHPCPAAHSCWQALAEALPRMHHLEVLGIDRIALPSNFDPSYFQTLSSGLTRLSSLCNLGIDGHAAEPHNVAAATDAHLSASGDLAAAIGTLTSLYSLSLRTLYPFLQEHECHVRLTRLTGLARLYISDLAPDAAPDVGEARVSMLAGMTRLTSLQATDDKTSERATLRVLSEAVPALPLLETLYLPACTSLDAYQVLADKIRAGSLARLREVLCMGASRVAILNSIAGRDVFHEIPSFDDDGSLDEEASSSE